MFTLNKIIALQQTFATNHLQINNFIFAPAYRYESDEQIEYPLLLVDVLTSEISGAKDSSVWKDIYTFDITIVDLVKPDIRNETEVLSDCKLMMNDFLIHFRQTDFSEYLSVDTNVSMEPVRLSGTDFTSGWNCKLKFEIVTDPDLCGIPT